MQCKIRVRERDRRFVRLPRMSILVATVEIPKTGLAGILPPTNDVTSNRGGEPCCHGWCWAFVPGRVNLPPRSMPGTPEQYVRARGLCVENADGTSCQDCGPSVREENRTGPTCGWPTPGPGPGPGGGAGVLFGFFFWCYSSTYNNMSHRSLCGMADWSAGGSAGGSALCCFGKLIYCYWALRKLFRGRNYSPVGRSVGCLWTVGSVLSGHGNTGYVTSLRLETAYRPLFLRLLIIGVACLETTS